MIDQQDYPHRFFGSQLNAIFMMLMGLGFFCVIVYGFANGRTDAAPSIFFLVIAVSFFLLGWWQLTTKVPQLQFGPTGIWTQKLGHLPWRHVTLKLGSVSSGKAGTMYTVAILDRQTRRHLQGVIISGLDHSSTHIENALRTYSKAHIIED